MGNTRPFDPIEHAKSAKSAVAVLCDRIAFAQRGRGAEAALADVEAKIAAHAEAIEALEAQLDAEYAAREAWEFSDPNTIEELLAHGNEIMSRLCRARRGLQRVIAQQEIKQ